MADDDHSRDVPQGRPLALDPTARSASTDKPAFLARPEGAPVYHGFQVLDDVGVDGFTFGKITDFESADVDCGDAFVIAPDGSRAGLVWEYGESSYFHQVMAAEPDRWGVWGVGFARPMTNRENARKNLESILPELKKKWEAWRDRRCIKS
jgi:hypothetical protein